MLNFSVLFWNDKASERLFIHQHETSLLREAPVGGHTAGDISYPEKGLGTIIPSVRCGKSFVSVAIQAGMTPTELAARYRGYAAKLLIVAQKQESTSDKLTLIDMAQAWAELAEQIDETARPEEDER